MKRRRQRSVGTARRSRSSGSSARRLLVGLLVAASVVGVARPALADFWERPTPDLSIYKISPWIDGAIILGSNAVTVGFYAFGQGMIHPDCPCAPSSVNSFDRHAIGNHSDRAYDVGTIIVGASLLAPVALDVWDLGRFWPALEDVTVFAESLSLAGAFVTVAKFTVQRPFPRTYAGDPTLVGNNSGYRSFYSGHTTLAFTALSVASMTMVRRYDVWVVPWAITVVVGSTVATAMVLSGWHFPTDTIAGALFGTVIGVAVPAFHFAGLPVSPTVGVTPSGDGPALSFVGTWR